MDIQIDLMILHKKLSIIISLKLQDTSILFNLLRFNRSIYKNSIAHINVFVETIFIISLVTNKEIKKEPFNFLWK